MKAKNLKLMGILYSDYKPNVYFWEFIKIFLKSLIVIINNYLKEKENPMKASMLCVLLISYTISIKKSKLKWFSCIYKMNWIFFEYKN